MGSCSSTAVEFDIEGECNSMNPIVNKKVSELTEKDKEKMNTFKSQFEPIHDKLEKNVTKARQLAGKRDDPSFDDFAKATAGLKRLIRITKKSINEQEERGKKYHLQAIEWKQRNDLEKCKACLILEKKCKKNNEELIKRVDMLYGRLQDNKETDMCGAFMNVMEGIANALRSIHKDIQSLEPDQLKARLDEMDEYLKELDCSLEDSVDENYDDILAELDDSIESNKVVDALPDAPTHVVTKEEEKEPIIELEVE